MNENVLSRMCSRIKSTWDNWSTRKQVTACGVAALALIAVIGGVAAYHSPSHIANRANAQQNRMIKHSPTHDKSPKKYNPKRYRIAGGVPALDKIKKERREDPHPYFRGQVSIPEYGVDVPILEGTALPTLAWGAGTARPNEEMGKGNFAIEAHNFIKVWDRNRLCDNWFFSNFEKHLAPEGDVELSNVRPKLGTTVYALNKHHVYKYILIKRAIKNIKDPYAGKMLTNATTKMTSDGKTPTITMATCYEQDGILFPNQRIVLVGQLVKTFPRSQFPVSKAFKDV